jgi:hypothetical protein
VTSKCHNPLLIVGTERSGSNLLRLILNAHSAIAIPHPPHIVAYFHRLERYYRHLPDDVAFAKLTDDVLRHIAQHLQPWPILPDRRQLLRVSPRDLLALYLAAYDQYLGPTGKLRWGCKSTFMLHHVESVLERLPAAQFIWLVRDPRDVANSSKSSVFNPYHPYFTAQLWTSQQTEGLRLQLRLNRLSWLRVSYESLVQSPHETVHRICGFLGISFQPQMLQFFETSDARTLATAARDWRNVGQPISSGSVNSHRSRLSTSEIDAVESVAGEVMETLGYARYHRERAAALPSLMVRLAYRARNEYLRLRVEGRSVMEGQFHWRRWRRAVRMLVLMTRLRLGFR